MTTQPLTIAFIAGIVLTLGLSLTSSEGSASTGQCLIAASSMDYNKQVDLLQMPSKSQMADNAGC